MIGERNVYKNALDTLVCIDFIGFMFKNPDGTVAVANMTDFDNINKIILNGYEFTKTAEI